MCHFVRSDGGPYVFPREFYDQLAGHFSWLYERACVIFWPLSRNNEWFLCCKTDAAKDLLLASGQLLVKKYVFRVRSTDRDQFKARIHWAPPYLPDEVLTNFLSKYGKVHATNFEMCISKGFEGVRTRVRSVVMSESKQDIPHIIPLLYEGDKSELLVMIPGRQPLCLQCWHEGHFLNCCD